MAMADGSSSDGPREMKSSAELNVSARPWRRPPGIGKADRLLGIESKFFKGLSTQLSSCLNYVLIQILDFSEARLSLFTQHEGSILFLYTVL